MRAGLTNCIDSSSSYLANLISKSGRNEVQVYSISNTSDSISLDQVLMKVELQADENIVDAVWINQGEQKNKQRGKKRSNGNGPVTASGVDSQALVVLVETGDIIIFLPYKDASFERISSEVHFIGLTATPESLWAYSQTDFHQISLETHATLKKVSINENLSIAKAIFQKSMANKSQIVIGDELRLIEPLKKNTVIREFENSPKEVSKIVQSTKNNGLFYVLDNSENMVLVYDVSKSTPISKFNILGVRDIYSISNETTEILMGITENGVQYFNLDSKLDEPVGCIKTNFEEKGIYFSSVYLINNKCVGIWYDSNEPKIANIDWQFNSKGETKVSIDYFVKDNNSAESNNLISMPESTDINNLSSDVLYKELLKLLTMPELDEFKVIKLCETNDNPTNIKEVVKEFFHFEDPASISNKLFQIISKEVSNDPSKKSSLSIWLKWLLLAHGGSIATKQYENLNNLHSGICSAMNALPRLIALQGRLKLLQSQGNLRSQQSQLVDDVEFENEDDTLGLQATETSIVYANGENDEEEFEDMEGELIENGEDGGDDEEN